jgi:hypothetical protein
MSMPQMESETRRALNPLFNDNKLKLGLFGVNVSNGCAITTLEGRHKVTWPTNLAIAQVADRYGYEALVPVARWRGFGGDSNFNGTNFETYTWAAARAKSMAASCKSGAIAMSFTAIPRKKPKPSSIVTLSRRATNAPPTC